ncbi:MAG: CpsB/CapC family capsule biosynthesis tyrosine phosphatase [Acidobacteriota bacterium]
MIDLHTHLIPGVDDGARDLAEAVEMCRLAASDGCRTLIATPHLRQSAFWNADRADLERRFAELRNLVGDLVDLRLGGEIHAHDGVFAELDALPDGDLLPLAGTRSLLLELDFRGVRGVHPMDLVHETTVAGWRPILAHPERLRWLMDDLDLIESLVAAGCRLQITAMSLTGALGPIPREACLRLLRRGLVHFVASDMHGVSLRPPGLSKARSELARLVGEAAAQRIMEENPQRVLADEPVAPTVPSEPSSGRRGLLGLGARS